MRFFRSELTHGVTGITVGVAGLTLVQHVNAWLQTIQFCLTITVTILTIASIIRAWRNKSDR